MTEEGRRGILWCSLCTQLECSVPSRAHESAGAQDTVDLEDSSDGSSSEGTGGLTASGGNTQPAPDATSSGGLLAAASVAAPAAGPSSNITAVTLATDPDLVRPRLPFTVCASDAAIQRACSVYSSQCCPACHGSLDGAHICIGWRAWLCQKRGKGLFIGPWQHRMALLLCMSALPIGVWLSAPSLSDSQAAWIVLSLSFLRFGSED